MSLATSMGVFPSRFWSVLQCVGESQSNIDGITLGKGRRWFNLHGSAMLQKKIHTLLAAIASGIMQRGVLVLVQSVHCSTSLKKDLGTLQLKHSSQNSLSLLSIKIPNRCNKYENKCTHSLNAFYHLLLILLYLWNHDKPHKITPRFYCSSINVTYLQRTIMPIPIPKDHKLQLL